MWLLSRCIYLVLVIFFPTIICYDIAIFKNITYISFNIHCHPWIFNLINNTKGWDWNI